jgi:hypothetical protein
MAESHELRAGTYVTVSAMACVSIASNEHETPSAQAKSVLCRTAADYTSTVVPIVVVDAASDAVAALPPRLPHRGTIERAMDHNVHVHATDSS